nr:hypothetical protein [Burkholderia ambifaria]
MLVKSDTTTLLELEFVRILADESGKLVVDDFLPRILVDAVEVFRNLVKKARDPFDLLRKLVLALHDLDPN